MNRNGSGQVKLTLYEDLKHLEKLKRIKEHCRNLRRDRYLVLAACLALLDGNEDLATIRNSVGMASHKASTVRRIVSQARNVISMS